MGALISRQNAAIEEVDIVSNHAYKYPPKSGNYFGNHFIMGGERFETPQPEAYLFGENGDLNFLGSRPTPFPYPPPQANEPTKTLKSLVNIRKESLRLVRVVGSGKGVEGDAPAKSAAFNIEFTFDCDARTAITIYYFATEEFTPNGVVYCPKDPSLTSETYMYERGTNQLFSQPTHVFEPGHYTDDELAYGADKEVMPVAIHCVTAHQPGSDDQKQSHTSIAVVERHSDGTYVLKALKQRLYVDGLCYLLQEIYGIENKASDICKVTSDGEETEDGGSECVICMCDVRDTLILPCRHLCLCNSCADSLRYQANNCPICRAPFRALLQIRALQKSPSANTNAQPHQENSDGIPPGFEAVSLIEALNGPSLGRSGGGGVSVSAAANLVVALETGAAENTAAAQLAAEALNRSTTADKQPECIPTSVKLPPEADVGGGEEVRMSVLLAREGSQDSAGSKSKGRSSRGQGGDRTPRDTVRVINEIAPTQDETQDEDSEAEKLSPLLDAEKKKSCSLPAPRSPSRSHALADDDHHVPHTSGLTAVGGPGDESEDYYTPEDPATTILSPLHCDDKDPGERSCVEVGGARVCWRGGGDGLSLPGTPLSTASHRSSGDSYSSGGSTRLLLSTHDKTTVA